ncbi:hypothetical protein LMG26858_04415 [Achromobacter anxifer]|uniref:Replication protein P n=1 Tax=Achromobacter anxifer TaxID=1287737 RepID=A0A6S7EBW3_9BURK|nr:hypothetical protein [Achromobacter anxifer]CAB3904617.1 hypothetical protein LMG26858_04415 [Achromobacter anxifer]
MSQLTNPAADAALGGMVVAELRLMYGSKFAQAWEGLTPREVKDAWNQKLAGYTEAEARVGLVACLSRDWPPTLPEFMRLCRPWTVPEVAFHDAVAGMNARRRGEIGNWPHPAIYWAAVAVGTHDLLNCGYAVLKARWERAFSEELARGQWHAVPTPAPALPAPGATRATKEDAEKALRAMGAGAIMNESGRDPRRGAKRILAEAGRKGGRQYSPTVIAMAKAAMDAYPDTGAQA